MADTCKFSFARVHGFRTSSDLFLSPRLFSLSLWGRLEWRKLRKEELHNL